MATAKINSPRRPAATNLQSATMQTEGHDSVHVRGRISNNMPNPLDRYFGKRMRLRREVLKLSQMDLADNLGVTFQQVQKYEKGLNRVGWSRACDIADVLGTTLDFFRAGMDPEDLNQSPMRLHQKRKKLPICPPLITVPDPMTRSETLELVESYYSINNRELAKTLFYLMKNMAHTQLNQPKKA